MRITYLIIAHNTPNHLARLVRALDSPAADFLIHVDRKSDISCFRDGLSQPTVAFLNDRIPVNWGDFSDVAATVRLIEEALKRSLQPNYLCLLSGSDYPLRSPKYIEAFFSRNQGRQFINLVQMPCEDVGKPIERLTTYWLRTPNGSQFAIRAVERLNRWNTKFKLVRRDYLKALKDLVPYAGSQWWALTTDACRHILAFIDSRPEVVKFFNNVYMPDESFFQTIIGNSQFSKDVVRNLTYADWSRPTGGPAIIDGDHLSTFVRMGRIIADDRYGRGELLFARKFPDDSSHLTDFIDAHLMNYCDHRVAVSDTVLDS